MIDKVVVTGLGASTPLGGDVETTWAALLAGESGVSTLTEDWAEQLPVRIAARVKREPAEVLDRLEARRLDRATQFAAVAVREAWRDAGLELPDRAEPEAERELRGPDPERVGVTIGTGIGGVNTLLSNYDMLLSRGPSRVSPIGLPNLLPNNPAVYASILIGAKAEASAPNSACASGAEALARALDTIRLGRADIVVAGGTEAPIHPLTIAGFARMMAMSRQNDEPQYASRPYDKKRDGFVMGEGAAVLVLERESHARARGAHIYCTLAGAGISSDAFHIAQPDEQGSGLARALGKMFVDSGLAARDVRHISTHATSTPQGDLAESRAVLGTLGRDGYVVSAIKSMTGHLLGAAGSLGALATVLALRDGLVPPTRNIDDLDDEIEFDIARSAARTLPPGPLAAVTTGVGFGGHNVALAFSRG